MITIIKDKELINDIFQYDVILIGTSIMNSLGNGFQYQIKINFPFVEKINKETNYGDKRKLGTVKVVNSNPIFCLLYINSGRRRPDINPEYLDYDALENCIKLINENFQGKKIASTIIGLDKFEGDGDRHKILDIIQNNSTNIDLYLYDYQQISLDDERNERWNYIVSQINKISRVEYEKLKKEYIWRNAFGIYKPIPYELTITEMKKYIKKEKESK